MREISKGHQFVRALGAVLVIAAVSAVGAVPVGATSGLTLAWTCHLQGNAVPVGNPLVADPAASLVSSIAAPLSDPATVTATPQVEPGGVIDYHLTIGFDVTKRAQLLLDALVIPAIASPSQFDSPAIAATAELNLHISQYVVVLPQPQGATFVGTPTVSSGTGGPVTSVSAGPSGLRVAIGPVTGSARQAASPPPDTTTPDTGPFTLTLDAQAKADVGNGVVTLHPGDLSAQFQGPSATVAGYDIGVSDPAEGGTLYGGWNGREQCGATDQVLASTTVGTGAATTTTTSSTTSTVPATTSTSAPATTIVATTAVPSTSSSGPMGVVEPAATTTPLARTGTDILGPLTAAVVLVALGVGVLVWSRRRTSS